MDEGSEEEVAGWDGMREGKKKRKNLDRIPDMNKQIITIGHSLFYSETGEKKIK